MASWIRPQRDILILQIVRSFVEPLLYPGRKLQERVAPNLPIDFSPIVAIVMLDFIKELILSFI